MKISHILLFGTNAFGIGLLAPVLSLVLLSHGASMETLSLCIGIFAAMVVLLELPSGILADLIGRKRIFLISAGFMAANYVLLLFSSHFLMLAAACAMQGIGRAFSSGSIEALEIETYMEKHGNNSLEKINSTMAVTESFGLAFGSVVGGILGYMDSSYTFLLILAIFIQLLLVLLTACFVRETAHESITCSPMLTFKNQLHALYSSLRHSLSVTVITMMAAAVGMALCTVEVYWQPTLKIFLPERLGWLFGVVTCLGYLGVTVGNKAMEAVMNLRRATFTPEKTWQVYWLSRFLLVTCIAGLGFSRRTWLFLLLFVLAYAVLGAGNLIENTLFHKAVPNSQRASMMSLLSLSTRAGGLITSLLGGVIVSGLSLSFIWVLLPLAAVVMIGGIAGFFYHSLADRCAAETRHG